MNIQDLNKLADTLSNIRRQKDQAEEKIAEKKAQFEKSIELEKKGLEGFYNSIEKIQAEMLFALQDNNLKQWKTDKATISRKTSTIYKVVDAVKLIDKLKKLKLFDEYVEYKFKPYIKELFKEKEMPGVEKEEKEFISVLISKK